QWQAHMLQIVEKMFMETAYDFDTVVTFVHGEYRKPVKKRDPESEEGGNDYQYANKFILCSLNKTDLPQSTFVFDYIGITFKSSDELYICINCNNPFTGFLFPAFHNYASDGNHLLYTAGKDNEQDKTFIDDV